VAHDDRQSRRKWRRGLVVAAVFGCSPSRHGKEEIERVNKKSGTNRGVLKRGRSIGDAAVAAVVVTETVKGTCATVMFTDCGDANRRRAKERQCKNGHGAGEAILRRDLQLIVRRDACGNRSGKRAAICGRE